jgi:hypothetical protein
MRLSRWVGRGGVRGTNVGALLDFCFLDDGVDGAGV